MNSLSPESIQQLLNGDVVSLSTDLETRDREPILLACYILPSEYPTKWVLVTALAGRVAIGFVDGRFFGLHGTSGIESPYTTRDHLPYFQHNDIRRAARDDGLFVVTEERRRGVGRVLMETIKDVLQGLGAKRLFVVHPKPGTESFYSRMGMIEIINGFVLVLDDEGSVEGQT